MTNAPAASESVGTEITLLLIMLSVACEAVPTGGSISQTYLDKIELATNAVNADIGCEPVAFVGIQSNVKPSQSIY